MRVRFTLPLLSVLLLVAADEPAIKNLAARQAIAKFEAACKVADEVARGAKVKAGKELVASLEQAKGAAMKAGSLDDANSIQEEIAKAQAAVQSDPSLAKALVGSEWTYENGRAVIRYDGNAVIVNTWKGGPGRWRVLDEHTIEHTEPTGRICQVTFNRERTYAMWVFPDGKPPRVTWMSRK